ncbi:HDOD domain-containing protein [Methylomonas sp. LL1]|uniref:HDOD domain-containing protein n=1 Tax=Methylomonas sp. LL1 TaxID=2785785 RepID=UPI0018C428D0|nr:HDOD domain-containing protein [Methylomonas sp. LL1]QPK62092.1 HDOD domain-containing protein [Methylomonas sp. LL1]
MTTINDDQLLTFVDKMPAFRGSVQRLLQLAADINADSREIVQVIETDPIMTVKVLKVINSPFYGLAQKISSVQRAVVHLGINTVKNMALSVAVMGVLPAQNQAGFDNRAFLLHSLTSAAICKLLAERLKVAPIQGSDYFVAGLLHDFGKIVFAEFVPATYKTVLQTASEQGMALNQVEIDILGVDHSQAGKLLAEHWGLGPGLIEAIDHHHSDHQRSALSDCLFAANQISKKLEFGFAGNSVIEELPPETEQCFGMGLDGLIADLGDISRVKSEAMAFID